MLAEALPIAIDWSPMSLPPAFVFLGGALLVLAAGALRLQALQKTLLLLTPVVGLVNLLGLDAGTAWVSSLYDFELVGLRVDRLSFLFGLLFHLGAFIAFLFALRERDTVQHVAAMIYAASALGAVFAGDLVTLFFYWEGLALSSVFLVWARRTHVANRAGFRYLVVHLASGLLLLAGALLHYEQTGSIAFEHLGTDTAAGWLILAAVGVKCGFPLLHNWITDAYPEATPSGTVFLSMLTTKVAVYALARGFAGTELLIPIGTVMAVFPIFYAVIENDLRRVLGYSMINQIGFMVAGIGIGTELAMNGAVAHAFNEVLFKGLLFMSMGAVLFRVGHVYGSDLGGLYKSMPWTTMFCAVGAASISAFPLFNGFVSKSMIMAAMVEHGYIWSWLALLFASAGVFHHAGIKIPYFAFFSHDSGIRTREAPLNMLLAMGVAAALCIFVGSNPQALYALLPWTVDYVPYTYPHVLAQLQLLFFSALAFAWLKLSGIYPPELHSVNLDADWSYRKAVPRVAMGVVSVWQAFAHGLAAAVRASGAPLRSGLSTMQGGLERFAISATATLLVAVLLAGSLIMNFIFAV